MGRSRCRAFSRRGLEISWPPRWHCWVWASLRSEAAARQAVCPCCCSVAVSRNSCFCSLSNPAPFIRIGIFCFPPPIPRRGRGRESSNSRGRRKESWPRDRAHYGKKAGDGVRRVRSVAGVHSPCRVEPGAIRHRRHSLSMNRVVARASRPFDSKLTGETPVPLRMHPPRSAAFMPHQHPFAKRHGSGRNVVLLFRGSKREFCWRILTPAFHTAAQRMKRGGRAKLHRRNFKMIFLFAFIAFSWLNHRVWRARLSVRTRPSQG
jgi:hypothetical protein